MNIIDRYYINPAPRWLYWIGSICGAVMVIVLIVLTLAVIFVEEDKPDASWTKRMVD